MIDETTLTAAHRCPRCAAPLTGRRCEVCGLSLNGPLAARLWDVSMAAAQLLEERAGLIAQLAAAPPEAAAPPLSVDPLPPASMLPRAARSGRRDTDTSQVKNVLLALGAALLAVAALIFMVLAWGRLGTGGRAACLAGATLACGAGAELAMRRRLLASAEAVAALGIVLALLDAYAVRRLGLGGLDAGDGWGYWAGASAVVAATAGVLAALRPLRATRLSACFLAQLAGWLLVVHVSADLAKATVALLLTAAVSAAVLLPLPGDVRRLAALGLAPAWLAAVDIATTLASDRHESGAVIAGGVAVLAGAAAVAGTLAVLLQLRVWREVAAGAAALGVLCVAASLLVQVLPSADRPLGIEVVSALLLGAVLALPRTGRVGAGLMASLFILGGAAGSAVGFAQSTVGPLLWPLDQHWSASLPATTSELVVPGQAWEGSPRDALAALVLGAAAVLVTLLAGPPRRVVRLVAAGAAIAALPVVLVALNGPWAVTVLVGTAGAGGALALASHRRHSSAMVAAGVLLGFFTAWSAAERDTSLVCIALALAATAAAVALSSSDVRPVLLVAVTGLAATEAAAAVRGAGGPRTAAGLAVVLVGVVAAGVATAGAGRLHRADRLALEVSAAVVAAVSVGVAGQRPGWTALILTVAGVAAAAVAVRRDRRDVRYLCAAVLGLASVERFVLSGGGPVESYVLPPAAALLALGALTRWEDRRSGVPMASSWNAYGAGLVLALPPSLGAAVDDDGLLRPMLLGLAAVGVLLVGARQRLQAPLILGSVVVVVDAVAQVAPYAAALLPRWVSVGAIGLLLLGLGVTYERQVQHARTLRRRYATLH